MKKKIVRRSKETQIEIVVGRSAERGLGHVEVSTTLPFFDHMLTALARYGGLDLRLRAEGDLRHHIMEDVAIALGRAVRSITPAAAARYGERTIPMDDALVQAVIDVGGRSYFEGELPNRLYTHVLRSLADSLGASLHVRVLRGKDRHHVIEAAFKATGLALRQALADTGGEIFSTKGAVELVEEDVP
ncbi:MAG: imidazoleglycerol-phosphate dehydratase [Myxococcales bacterium]|nr:imidazoleglycerol-phosphate dehydratase [Myxococcales bacterium]